MILPERTGLIKSLSIRHEIRLFFSCRPASLVRRWPASYHGQHGGEGDALPQTLHHPDHQEEGEVGPGGQGGEHGQDGGDEDAQSEQPLSPQYFSQAPPGYLGGHVAVEKHS